MQQNSMNYHLLAQDEFLSTRELILKFEKDLLSMLSKENKVNFIVYYIQKNTINFHFIAHDEFLSTRELILK